VIHALKKYHYSLYRGALIHAFTDHRSLIGLMTSLTKTTGELNWWRLSLQYHNLWWHRISGKDHGRADCVSTPSEEVLARYASAIEGSELDPETTEYDPFLSTDSSCMLFAAVEQHGEKRNLFSSDTSHERVFLDIDHEGNIRHMDSHCSIQLVGDSNAKPERVHFKQLVVHCRDEFTVTIYPYQDWTRRTPNPELQKPLFENDELPKHGYNTRSKALVGPMPPRLRRMGM